MAPFPICALIPRASHKLLPATGQISAQMLTIHLDPSQCFCAEAYKSEVGLGPEDDDEKSMWLL